MGVKKRDLTPKVAEAAKDAQAVAQIEIEMWSIHKLRPYEKNPRKINDKAIEKVANSLTDFGFRQPIVVDSKGVVIVGHTRLLAAKKLGLLSVPVHVASDLDARRARAYRLADNKTSELTGWLDNLLAEELSALGIDDFDMTRFGFDDDALDKLLAEAEADSGSANMLADKFMIPPFSVLNAREGWWQERKAQWIAIGIQSELGRGGLETNTPHVGTGMADGLVALRAQQKARKANAIPGGAAMPLDRAKNKARANG